MKKHSLVLAIISVLIIAGCQTPAASDTPKSENQAQGNVVSPIQSQQNEQVNAVRENNTVEKSGLKVSGDVSEDFKMNKITTPPSTIPTVKFIAITDKGFQPQNIDLKVGEKLTFVNADKADHWPASDPHPTHTLCPGFDSLKALKEGENYEISFQEAKTCTFHDHLNPSLKGSITIK